jgi:hypothetical protein
MNFEKPTIVLGIVRTFKIVFKGIDYRPSYKSKFVPVLKMQDYQNNKCFEKKPTGNNAPYSISCIESFDYSLRP